MTIYVIRTASHEYGPFPSMTEALLVAVEFLPGTDWTIALGEA